MYLRGKLVMNLKLRTWIQTEFDFSAIFGMATYTSRFFKDMI